MSTYYIIDLIPPRLSTCPLPFEEGKRDSLEQALDSVLIQ